MYRTLHFIKFDPISQQIRPIVFNYSNTYTTFRAAFVKKAL